MPRCFPKYMYTIYSLKDLSLFGIGNYLTLGGGGEVCCVKLVATDVR